MRRVLRIIFILTIALTIVRCGKVDQQPKVDNSDQEIVGAWRAKIQFQTGAFAQTKDLEFMYLFNQGGTLMESSNYDATPPVPPAYGIWRMIGERKFEARYEYYATRPPDSSDHFAPNAGWLPAGHGELCDTITVASDGRTFESTTHYTLFDQSGKPIEGGGIAVGQGANMKF